MKKTIKNIAERQQITNKLSIKFEFENFKCFENKMQIKSVFLKNHFDYI